MNSEEFKRQIIKIVRSADDKSKAFDDIKTVVDNYFKEILFDRIVTCNSCRKLCRNTDGSPYCKDGHIVDFAKDVSERDCNFRTWM